MIVNWYSWRHPSINSKD